jgi:[protein-PII] uridylyltransferase
MDRRAPILAPYFDPASLRRELTRLHEANAEKPATARAAVLARLKDLLRSAREAAHGELDRNGDGRACAAGLSRFTDELLNLVFDYTVFHVYPSGNPSSAEHMAIVATGGYGRGLMAPRSDIDLLFLIPYKQTPWGESVVEHMLYLLWDLKLKVGHAVRTVDQCLRLAEEDMTIRTAILDARMVIGSDALFGELQRRFRDEVVRRTGRAFIEAKLAERDARHARTGESRYRVEPNVKDGKGGLRDLHTLHWLMKDLHEAAPNERAVEKGVFTPAELRAYRKCEDFLWTVRCQLHFHAGRAEERLSFDLQPALADALGYKAHGGLRAVERFMRHYFLMAREVGSLTRIVCTALELKQLKAEPLNEKVMARLSWEERARLRRRTDFRIENGRLNTVTKEVFRQNPSNLLRLFQLGEEYDVEFHPDAIRLVRQSLPLIDERLRADPEANRIFLELLTSRAAPERALRAMNETGVLGAFLPPFGRVVAMMQFNMYHHFTVDEHSIRSVGVLSDIEAGRLVEDHPLASRIIKDVQSRRVLYVAQLLHDVGKGRKEDHSIVGGRIARTLGARLGLSKAETETVAWLIENHLVMSTFAQSRDLADPKTISDFAGIVQSPERLRLLLILTVCDIRAVGPGVWNGWKGQLLRTLYSETEPVLAGGHSREGHAERLAAAAAMLREKLPDWEAAAVDRFITRQHPSYLLRTDPARQAEHARLLARTEGGGRTFGFEVRTDAFTAVTELSVLAPSVSGLLALFAGACAAAGANIVGAHISTTRDGLALDTFLLQRELDEADERRRARRIGETIGRLIEGTQSLEKLMARRPRPRGSQAAFRLEPEVVLNNALSHELTVIEVSGLDRPGLLYDLTSALADLELDIVSAHITTYGERAVDVFYVTDLEGRQLGEEARQARVKARLEEILRPRFSPA